MTFSSVCFGDCRNSSGNLPAQRFTGQRLDTTELYYYGARYYDASIGRFVSADTIVPHPTNPQSLNRYSYCLNNPLKYVDPNGHADTYTVQDLGSGNYQVTYGNNSWTLNPYNMGGYIASIYKDNPSVKQISLPLATSNPVTTSPPATSTPKTTNTTTTNNRGILETVGQTIFDTVGKANNGLNNFIGNTLGTLGGGTPSPGPGGTTIYTNVNPNSLTGKLEDNVLNAYAFTVGYVIITEQPQLPTDKLQHELGHVTQDAILGTAYLPSYFICWLAAGGNWNNNIMEVGPLHPNWPAR